MQVRLGRAVRDLFTQISSSWIGHRVSLNFDRWCHQATVLPTRGWLVPDSGGMTGKPEVIGSSVGLNALVSIERM
jgi:hypothetical protein